MRQIVRQWPDSGEERNEVCPRVREGKLDGLRWGRRLAPQYRGIEIEQSGDELPAIFQRRGPDELSLKLHEGLTKQPRLPLQPARERGQITVVDGARDLLHDEPLPQSDRCRMGRSLFDEVCDECLAPPACIDVS